MIGDFAAGSTVTLSVNTRYGGVPTTLVGGSVAVYKDAVTTESTAGLTLTVDFDSRTGFHVVTCDTSADPTFYVAGSTYTVVFTAGTVGGASAVGLEVDSFRLLTAVQAQIALSAFPGTPPTATVRSLITGALQELGVIGAGQTPSAEDMDLGFTRLNDWIDSLATERLALPVITPTPFPIVANQATYSVGTGANIDRVRPVDVETVRYLDTSATTPQELSLGPALSDQAYQLLPQKTLTATAPNQWYYSPTSPTGTLYLFPIPTSTTLQGVFYAWTAISEFASIDDPVQLPTGYRRFVRSNLAVELGIPFGHPPDPVLLKAAVDSKAVIKRTNQRLIDLVCPVFTMGGVGYNIVTDQIN